VERSITISPAALLLETVKSDPLNAILAESFVTPLSLAKMTLLDPLLEIRSTSTSLYFLISIAFVGADVPIPMRWFELSTANAVPPVPTNNSWVSILLPTFKSVDTLTRSVSDQEIVAATGNLELKAPLGRVNVTNLNPIGVVTFTADALPNADKTIDLGSSTVAYAQLHADELRINLLVVVETVLPSMVTLSTSSEVSILTAPSN
jgi:hypothetical protein